METVYDNEEDADVILMDAEVDESNVFQVNYYLLFLAPLMFSLMKIFSGLSTWIAQFFFLPSISERNKIFECTQIKKQMDSLSMVDDFSAYSKFQRKLNHITLDLEAEALSRKALRADLARMILFGMYFILGTTYILTLTWYGTKIPVIVLPFDWFYPLGSILSYPTGVPGAVSLPVWTLLVRTVSSFF